MPRTSTERMFLFLLIFLIYALLKGQMKPFKPSNNPLSSIENPAKPSKLPIIPSKIFQKLISFGAILRSQNHMNKIKPIIRKTTTFSVGATLLVLKFVKILKEFSFKGKLSKLKPKHFSIINDRSYIYGVETYKNFKETYSKSIKQNVNF